MFAASLLAFCTGFLSLSLEILWIRLVSFSFHSLPQAFSYVLMMYLLGIAFGALIGKYLCKSQLNLWFISGCVLFISSVYDLISPWLYAYYIFSDPDFPRSIWLTGGAIIVISALLKAIVFPIAHHLGTSGQAARLGRNLSRVYAWNIIGATLGPLVTGIVMLALVTTQQAFILCALATLFTAVYCCWQQAGRLFYVLSTLIFASQTAALIFMNSHALMMHTAMKGYGDILQMNENPYGIITIYASPHRKFQDNHIVAGNNAYDGSTNLDPVYNFNGINRVIITSALVEQPTRVLMVGLSIGTWLKLVTTFPGVKEIDVIEINPGYLSLMKDYPAQQSALHDPRVHVYIDDGRRWLKAHPDKRYDLVIINTTYHWRAYSTNLLSQNFLQKLKQHMNPDAVLTYNTTSSLDALQTAASVFSHAYLYEKFVIAADFDWRAKLLSRAAQQKLSALMMDGKPLFPADQQLLIQRYLSERVLTLQEAKQYFGVDRNLEIITDRNMITEFKYGRNL